MSILGRSLWSGTSLLLLAATSCAPASDDAAIVSSLASLAPRGEELINVKSVSSASGTLDLIAIGASTSRLYHRRWNGSGWVPSNSWELVDNSSLFGVPSVIANGPNLLDVFAVHQGGDLLHFAWSGTAWSSESLGGTIEGSPAAVAWSRSRIDVFVVGTTDGALYQQTWNGQTWNRDGAGNPFWTHMSASIVGSPAVASWGPNRLDLFVVGASDRALYHKAWNGTSWSPAADGAWDRLPGQYSGTPSAVSWGSGRVDAFVVGSDAALYHWGYNGFNFTPAPTSTTTPSSWMRPPDTIKGSMHPAPRS